MNWEDIIKNVITVPKGRMRTSNKPIPEEEEEDCVAHWQDAMKNNGISKNKLSNTGFSRQFLLQNGVPEKLWCNLKNNGVVHVSHVVSPNDMKIQINVINDYGLNQQELQEFSEFRVTFNLFHSGTPDYFDLLAYQAETFDSEDSMNDKMWSRRFNLSARYQSDILTRADLTRLFLDVHTAFALGAGETDADLNRFNMMLKDFREFDIKRTGGSLDGTYTKNIFDEELGYTYWNYFTGDYSNVGKGITKSLIQKPKGKLKTSNKPIPEEEECKDKLMALIKKVRQSSRDDLLKIEYMPEVFMDDFNKKYNVHNHDSPEYKRRYWYLKPFRYIISSKGKTKLPITDSIYYFKIDKWDSLPEEVVCEALKMLKEVNYKQRMVSTHAHFNGDTDNDHDILHISKRGDYYISIHGGSAPSNTWLSAALSHGKVKGIILKITSTTSSTIYVKVGIVHRDFYFLNDTQIGAIPFESNFEDLSVEWWK
tara:strand:+ start:5947 stop:7389 length:1443 start_codon:yes stop_codon:yes gene_type:complete